MPQLLKTRYGVMNPALARCPVSRSLAQYGEWVEQELDLISEIVSDGHHVVELGSEFGAHTLWFARAVGERGRVHVIEPRRRLMQQLCANVALNGFANVHTHPIWVGSRSETVELGALVPRLEEPSEAKDPVSVRPLDDLGMERIDLLKVNYAGEIGSVLEGASATIRKLRPHLYFRMGDQDAAEEEVRRVKDLGYRCWSHVPYLYSRSNFVGNTVNLFPGRVYQNVIASPAEGGVAFDHLIEI